MSQRVDYMKQSPELCKKFVEFTFAAEKSSIEPALRDLVEIRASQINGCAFCVDMHVKQATIRGERPLRLYHIAIWRESPLFNPRERAALEWAEVLTKIPEHGVADEVYQRVRAQLSEKELSDLTFVVMSINAWNRINVGFTVVPGTYDKVYGLDKSGLS
ncbi:MAG TPA: carboxymuconolactone decarboxylase family protein [Rhodanobacteraceae bacterium]|nr:carboxymuconolactone decarboxylase family protein [Rhodanobacteraceae bacterium]